MQVQNNFIGPVGCIKNIFKFVKGAHKREEAIPCYRLVILV